MYGENRTCWFRGLGLWFLLMMAETLQGLWRAKVLAAWIGWIAARNPRTLLLVGLTWVVLTIGYEVALGRFAFRRSWAEIGSDFDLLHGRLFPIGLFFLIFAPLLAARLRGRTGETAAQAIRPRV